ncbi:MAG: glycosyltransferase family 4 protein [Desulfitobacteriaceae bacterium]
MKVLFQTRPDYLKNPAGDTVQIVSTGRALTSLGVKVVLSTDPNALLTDYDLVHIFNMTRIKESYYCFLNAQKQNKRIVISPIYWNPQLFLQRKEAKAKDLAAWKHAQPMRARLARECDLLLPNSLLEADGLKEDFGPIAPYQVVPNGFPNNFTGVGGQVFRERFPSVPEKFVLSVARLSPRKNQHWLARTCKDLGLTLVLAGPVNDRNYGDLVRSFSNVTYAGTLQGQLLASAYAAATVHALPSWFETPGLSSLEAAACGTVVVSTDQGSPREYFLEHALYVNPLEEQSLRSALEEALKFSPLPLTKHVLEHYSWSQVGQATLAAYQRLLNR